MSGKSELEHGAGEPFATVWRERGGDLVLPPLDASHFTSAQLELARRVWQERVMSEYRSIQIMVRFLGELAGAGEPADVLGCAVDMVEDEVRHAAACAAMVRALGGTPQLPTPIAMREPEAYLKAPMNERALHTAITMLVINETLSVAFVEDLQQRCDEPAVRAVLDATLADEEGHQDLGWAFVERGLSRFPKSTLADWRHLVERTIQPHQSAFTRILEAVPSAERTLDHHPDREHAPLGLFTPQRQAIVGQRALRERVLPRLRALDLA